MSAVRVWIKERIELWTTRNANGLEYNDCELVRKHPFLLRVRLRLALWRMKRRERKLSKFLAAVNGK